MKPDDVANYVKQALPDEAAVVSFFEALFGLLPLSTLVQLVTSLAKIVEGKQPTELEAMRDADTAEEAVIDAELAKDAAGETTKP